MKIDYHKRFRLIRDRIEASHNEFSPSFDDLFRWIDEFISSKNISDLEKEFYLLLNQYPGDPRSYIIIPHEKVLVENIYGVYSPPFIEYEIDFAIYGGAIDKPVKIALECDGIRTHNLRHGNKDRKKEVNLQLSGWIVIRFASREIHEEIEQWERDENFISQISDSIDWVVKQRLDVVDHDTYTRTDVRNKLTGYNWGSVTCPNCKFMQYDILNHKKILCRKCNKKYIRDRSKDPEGSHELNGLIIFPKKF